MFVIILCGTKKDVSFPLIAFLVGLFEKTLPKLRERIQDIDL